MAIASTHRSEIVRQRQQQRSQQHQPQMQPSRSKRASTKSRDPSAQSFTNLDEKERKYFNEPARKLSSMLFDVFKLKC